MAKIKHVTIMESHICEYCGKEFQGRKGAKYCSSSCRGLACRARKDSSGRLRGIGQVTPEAEKTRVEARKVFQKEIIKHPEIIEQAQDMQQIGVNYAVPQDPRDSLRELLVLGAVAIGVNALFNPPKKRKK